MTNTVKSMAKTTQKSLRIVNAIRELDGASLDELATYLDLAPSTIHRHVTTLEQRKYVVSDGDAYQIGLQFLTLGGYAQRQTTAYPMIKKTVDELATTTGERVQFVIEEHGQRVYLYTEVGENAAQTGAAVGRRGLLHTSAAGKAILANLPPDRVDELLSARDLDAAGPNSITDRDALSDELEQIRTRGYAFNRQETTAGVNAVGAVVTGADDSVIGALSVSGPVHRVRDDTLTTALPEQLLGAVNELELHVTHAVDP